MNRPKILFVVHALGYGGVGKMLSYLANYVSESGFDVTIYVQEQIGQHYPQNDNITIIQETVFFKNYFTRRFKQIGQLRKRVKEINPDLVISFQTNQNALSVLATRKKKIPVIISERGDPYQYKSIVAILKNVVINRAEGGVFQTEKARKYFGKKLQKNGRVIFNPNTVPPSPQPLWEDRKDEIAFVARFDIKQKRQDIMLEAFLKITSEFPKMKLVFYGIGDDMESIVKDVERKGLKEKVIFKGLVKDIPAAIRTSKMFVLTSDYEGMPNALIEAMAVGLPCISTDCSPGGASALITTGVNGIIVPVRDSDSIARAMRYVLTNPIEAQKMGQEAQKTVDLLHPDFIYGQWIEYIREILNKNRNGKKDVTK